MSILGTFVHHIFMLQDSMLQKPLNIIEVLA